MFTKTFAIPTAADAVAIQGSPISDETPEVGESLIWTGTEYAPAVVIGGDVSGPLSSVDSSVPVFDGVTGKAIKTTPATIDGSGNIATPGTVDGRDVSADGSALDSHVGDKANPHETTAAQVGAIATALKGAANGVAELDAGGFVPDSQIPAAITRDSELSAHTGDTGNPHGTTATQVGAIPSTEKGAASGVAELDVGGHVPDAQIPDSITRDSELSAHTGDTGNPHATTAAQVGAVPTSDVGAADGVASLDSGGKIPDSEIPSTITRDTELASHVADTNPHSVTAAQTGAVPTTEKGSAGGVATLDAGGKIPAGQIPAVALPEVYVVADETARLALTVQEGDEAIQTDDGSHWIYDGSTWHDRPNPGGDVVGPASATTSAVALFDGATGKVIKNSGVTVDGSGNIATPGTVDGRDVYNDGAALDSHVADTGNPHSVSPAQIGAIPTTEKAAANGVATLDAGSKIPDTQIPDGITRDTELSTHTGNTSNPHAVSAAQVGAVPTTDKGAANGVATLDATAKIPDTQIPDEITRDSELSAHTGDSGNPHAVTAAQTGAVPTTEKGSANGVATLDAGGLIPDTQIPSGITRDSELSAHTGDTNNPHAVTATQAGAVPTTAVGAANGVASLTAGATLTASQFDDTSHGNRGGGALHNAATQSVAGFLSAADKTKLDKVPSQLAHFDRVPVPNSSVGYHDTLAVAQNGSGRLAACVPADAASIVAVELLAIPSAGASGSGKDIDFSASYGTIDESPSNHTASDTTSTYDLTGRSGLITVFDLTALFGSIAANDCVGIWITHNSIGGVIDYIGVRIRYNR